MIFGGGAKLVSMLGKAAKAGKGSSGNTPELSSSTKGDRCENSFSGDTPVLMADGTSKPISEIRPGDVVWATDPVSGIAGRRVVTHTWPHRDMLVILEVDGQSLATTEDHPFWSVTDQIWERADQLVVGEKVLAADGSAHLVTAPINLSAAFYDAAYNLTVGGLHTYHVLTDPDRGPPVDVLVHNCGSGARDGSGLSEAELYQNAIALRDEHAQEVRGAFPTRKMPGAVTAGYNVETGEYAAGHSSREGGCAEVCVVNQLGGDPSKIRFTPAVRPRTGRLQEICVACESRYARSQFVDPATTYATDRIASGG